jgi:5-amino-6-(5-phosphoribosylamino)uracil reductase
MSPLAGRLRLMMRVVSNTAVALDGRIATARYDHFALGTPLDRAYMSVLRARSDAVLVGGRTFRNWPLPLVPDPAALETLRAAGFPDVEVPPIAPRRWKNVVVTRTLDLPRAARFWGDPRVEPLVYAPVAGELPGLVVGPTEPRAIAADLARRGVTHLLLECGGDLLSQWLAAGLVDELYVTVCPLLLGGVGAPTLVDGPGFDYAGAPRLELLHAHAVGSELYCRYAVARP